MKGEGPPAGATGRPGGRARNGEPAPASETAAGGWSTWAEIDLGAVAHNIREFRRVIGPAVRLMAVVKADAYGHGADPVARACLRAGADALGVARLPEAAALREGGIKAPILVFGHTPPERAETLLDLDLAQAVHSLDAASALSRAASERGGRVRIHVKVDTGMGRLGIVAADRRAPETVRAVCALPGTVPEGIFTHFASADSADKTFARGQLSAFEALLMRLGGDGVSFPLRHAANSAALLELPEAHFDLVRPGIGIYGLYPSGEVDRTRARLKPAMTLKARVVQVKAVPEGFPISYGSTYATPAPTTIATVSVGYADGYDRLLSSRGHMVVRNRRAPVVGRVCMDLTMLDVGHIPEVAVGDEVVVLGRQGDAGVSADEIAGAVGTINYEVVSAITARVPRVYRFPEEGSG